MKRLLIIFFFLFLFGCNQILKKDKYKNESIQPSAVSSVPDSSAPQSAARSSIEPIATEEYYYLRYFNFQHANSTLREAQLEFMNNDGKRNIQALLLVGEAINSQFCNSKIAVKFDSFVNDYEFNDVFVTVNYLGKQQQFNLSRNDKSALQFSCTGIEKMAKEFTTKKEAGYIFVGEKGFTLENDLMSDNSCDINKEYNKVMLKHQDWYSRKFDTQPELRRYMFRPNTVFCIGNDLYTLEEDEESKQCYTHLGKRGVDTLGCRNLEGAIGPGNDNE